MRKTRDKHHEPAENAMSVIPDDEILELQVHNPTEVGVPLKVVTCRDVKAVVSPDGSGTERFRGPSGSPGAIGPSGPRGPQWSNWAERPKLAPPARVARQARAAGEANAEESGQPASAAPGCGVRGFRGQRGRRFGILLGRHGEPVTAHRSCAVRALPGCCSAALPIHKLIRWIA